MTIQATKDVIKHESTDKSWKPAKYHLRKFQLFVFMESRTYLIGCRSNIGGCSSASSMDVMPTAQISHSWLYPPFFSTAATSGAILHKFGDKNSGWQITKNHDQRLRKHLKRMRFKMQMILGQKTCPKGALDFLK